MDKESIIKNIAGYISLILFILISNPFLKLLLATIYIIISIFSGMRIKILPNILLLFSITFINLLVPQGEIIFKWNNIILTDEALFSGIEKSALLIGLMYLSKNITFSHIKIPGRAGNVIRDTFYYFNQLSKGDRIKPNNIIEQIDNKLLDLTTEIVKETNDPKTSINYLYLIFILTVLIFTLDNILLNF